MSDTTMEAACRRHDLTEAANLAAVLFALTPFFKKANEVGAGHLDAVDSMYAFHAQAEAARGVSRSARSAR